MWYILFNSTFQTGNNTWLGNISQTLWDLFGNGNISVRVYANDTRSYLYSDEILLYKDIVKPLITVNTPNPNQIVGSSPPSFVLNIDEPNIHSIWYSLDNGLTNLTTTTEGTINQYVWQNAWKSMSHGDELIIKFFTNDSAGNYETTNTILEINKPSTIPTNENSSDLNLILTIVLISSILGIIIVLKTVTTKKIDQIIQDR